MCNFGFCFFGICNWFEMCSGGLRVICVYTVQYSCQCLRCDYSIQNIPLKSADEASLVWLDIVHSNPYTFSFTNSNPTLNPGKWLLLPQSNTLEIKLCRLTSDFKVCAFFVSVLQHPFYFWNDTSHLFFCFYIIFLWRSWKRKKKKHDNDGSQWPVAMATLLYWSSQPSSPFTFAFTLSSLSLFPSLILFSYYLHPELRLLSICLSCSVMEIDALWGYANLHPVWAYILLFCSNLSD